MILAAIFIALWYSCNVKWQDAFYGATWAILQVQCAYEVVTLSENAFFGGALPLLPHTALLVAVFAVVCMQGYYVVAKRGVRGGRYNIGPRQLSSAIVLTTLFFVLFDIIVHIVDFKQSGFLPALLLTAQINCITIMYMQIDIFRKAALQKELDTMNFLYSRQQEQYALAKQNIKIINHKCHQLKMQIATLRGKTNDDALKQSLQQAEESIRIYDSITKTGNNVLDTLLTEKSLLCGAREIKINCVADGAQLNFMPATDLYALFAEAIENAIDAVSTIAEPEQRFIDVQVYRHQNFLVVNITNPLKGPLEMVDGLPVSTKPSHVTGGWGVRAMQDITKKYGGILSTEANNGVFVLHVVIPRPAEQAS
ncbi:MAG: ATP-binding protein, partial [Gemmiger sp.]|nr:ATP-binding protein [Gemmiger sp.]